ncbi:MAG: toprim domain-containing protein [Candidatus Gastranaerophilaceae bacterium]
MELILNNKVITADIPDILNEVKTECNGRYLKYVGKVRGQNVKITCPYHKDGQESHPSCNVFADRNDKDTRYGQVHCFTCGITVPLYSLVGHCLDEDSDYGKQWLLDRFGDTFINSFQYLEPIELDKKPEKAFLDESVLDKYNLYHPYLESRGISFEVMRRFKIGFDTTTNSVTFPVWDDKGRLVMITSRNVSTKQFYIPEDMQKPIYLLNFIKKENITTVYVVESQINALTLWSWGYPAIALIGTGSSYQYKILKNSGIRNYILCFDGDNAGDKGIERFKKNMPKDVFISTKLIPRGTDVNNLTKEEFDKLSII